MGSGKTELGDRPTRLESYGSGQKRCGAHDTVEDKANYETTGIMNKIPGWNGTE